MEKLLSGRKYLTKGSRDIFKEAVKSGKEKQEIVRMLGLDSEFATGAFNEILIEVLEERRLKNYTLRTPVFFGHKDTPYYDDTYNEMDAWQFPKYEMTDLGHNELHFFSQYEKKLNMDKFKRFKIDILLHQNAALMADLGMDSTNEEIKYVQKLKKENLKKIKEIDADFFDTIDDGEK